MFGTLAKRVEQFDRAERIPEILMRAFHTAVVDRPGPTIVAMPEDVLYAEVSGAPPPQVSPKALPARPDLQALESLLAQARRPMVIAGGGGWDEERSADLQQFAEQHALPVATSFRRQDAFDNAHPSYAGPLVC